MTPLAVCNVFATRRGNLTLGAIFGVDPVEYFQIHVWNNLEFVAFKARMPAFDAAGLSIVVTLAVLACWWLLRRIKKARSR